MKHLAPIVTAFVLCTALLTSACGNRLVRGESPFVAVDGIDAAGDTLNVKLRIRNINEVPIRIRRLRFRLMLEGAELARFDGARTASVIANGVETLAFDLSASGAGRDLLASLTSGEVPNLAYTLEGEIGATESEPLSFTGEGRIYPVPGRPGQFR